jgi:peptidoglycan/LPS O-acetylase OafA/YrhL
MRNKRLDVLRGVAIVLVLLFHGNIRSHLSNAGWVGVDLFFVLSGFLISGLLFAEYKRRGSISFKRFLIRRGLKIYPSYYLFLLVALLARIPFRRVPSPLSYVSQILYVQNYGPIIWNHTWSLAVEEHFYILLPIFFLLLIRYSSVRANPFRLVPLAFVVVAITCLAFRVAAVRMSHSGLQSYLVYGRIIGPTHERVDSLFFGVLLGYFYHFQPSLLDRILCPVRNRVALLILAAACLFPCLIVPVGTVFMLTLGLTLLYLGFGIVLMICLNTYGVLPAWLGVPMSAIGTAFAFIGVYSYSIYLWHEEIIAGTPVLLWQIFHIKMGWFTEFVVCFTGSVAFGTLMSRVIEYPVLRLRDRMFPALQVNSIKPARSEMQEASIPPSISVV